MAEFLRSGRIAAAKIFAAQTLHVAWGAGLPAWDATPESVNVADEALVAEVGRRLVTGARYAELDTAGDVIVDGVHYSVTNTPTNRLYVETTFQQADSPGADIREVAVFVGGTTAAGLPAGQLYFLPAQVETPGDMVVLEHIAVVHHTSSNEQTFRFVINF